MYGVYEGQTHEDAEYLLRRFKKGDFESGVNVREIRQSAKLSAERLRVALGLLERHGYVLLEVDRSARGPASTFVYINPAVLPSIPSISAEHLPS